MEKQKGITLIALVITIIVLLILAGVTISSVMGDNGVLSKADTAKIKTADGKVLEAMRLEEGNNGIEKKTEGDTRTLIEILQEKGILSEEKDYGYEINLKKLLTSGQDIGNGSNKNDVYVLAKTDEDLKYKVVYYDNGKMKRELGFIKDFEVSQAGTTVQVIEKNNSYVGYYADLTGDGTVDGIIYADLAIGGSGFSDGYGAYTIPVVNGLRDYYISKESYKYMEFEEKPVLSPKGSGKDRFYVMKLEDIDNNTHYWYKNASGNMDDLTYTSEEFGKGKENTIAMISKWNNNGYGEKNENDMWGLIKDEVNEGWFVPSSTEWVVFIEELGITSNNYEGRGLSDYCWSSSQGTKYTAWFGNLTYPSVGDNYTYYDFSVRLSTTF